MSTIRCEKLKAEMPECRFVRRLYETTFPVDERRDFVELLRLFRERHAFDMKVVYADDNPVGFITVWSWVKWRYIEHFAVDSSCRGQGVGAEILRRLLQEDSRPVVLEVEPPVDEWSRRRIGFYSRLGFVLHESFAYVQPAYGVGRNPVSMCLMTWGADKTVDLNSVVRLLHQEVYGCFE